MWMDRRTDRQRGTDMKKVVVSFRSSANAPKTYLLLNPVLRSLSFWCNVRWSTMCKPLRNVEGIDATVVFVCGLNLRNCYADVTRFWPVDWCGQYAKKWQSVAKYAPLLLVLYEYRQKEVQLSTWGTEILILSYYGQNIDLEILTVSTLASVFTCLWYSKTCLKRNAIVPVFFSPFSQVSVLQRVVF